MDSRASIAAALAACGLAVLALPAGCAAAEQREKVTLYYFASRGRAEPVRLFLEQLGVEYTDKRFAPGTTEWADDYKYSGKFAYQQVPGLTWCENAADPDTCVTVVQSGAILRFLARAYGRYGPLGYEHWVDMVADGAEDLRLKLSKVVTAGDEANSKFAEYTKPGGMLSTWLSHFERMLGPESMVQKQAGPGRFFTGDHITFADIYVYHVLELHRRLIGAERLFALIEGGAGHLEDFFGSMSADTGISSYVASGRQPEHANGNYAQMDAPNNPAPFAYELRPPKDAEL